MAVQEQLRARIIREIVRLAEESGGKPPGRKTFEQKTGIREGEWYGRLWPRWSAAVAEAGFSANVPPAAIDADLALEILAGLVRQLGRFPTQAELKMHQRINRQFPTESTLRKRFGSMAQLTQAPRQWCAARDQWTDVAKLVGAEPENHVSDPYSERQEGHVYLLKSGVNFRIGRTDNLARRFRENRIALPEETELVHHIKTDDPVGIEAYWLRRFEAKRIREGADWFKLSAADVAAFRKRRFM